jgi:hypothetical protein
MHLEKGWSPCSKAPIELHCGAIVLAIEGEFCTPKNHPSTLPTLSAGSFFAMAGSFGSNLPADVLTEMLSPTTPSKHR